MSSKTNCPNCGAPITGSVCEYCGTRPDTGITIRLILRRKCSTIRPCFRAVSSNAARKSLKGCKQGSQGTP